MRRITTTLLNLAAVAAILACAAAAAAQHPGPDASPANPLAASRVFALTT